LAVKALKTKDLGNYFRRQPNVLLEESIEISPRIAGLPLETADRCPAVDGSKCRDQ
jgi:hypothetical protein